MKLNAYCMLKRLDDESKQLLKYIQARGPIDKNSLEALTGYNIAKINRVLFSLEALGLIIHTGEGSSTGGRRPFLYDVSRESFFVLSLNIGTRHQDISIINLKAEVIAKYSFYNHLLDIDPDELMLQLRDKCDQMMDENGIITDKIIGLGAAAFASINVDTCQPQLKYCRETWRTISIKAMLSKYFPYPLLFDNAINCEALAHYRYNFKMKPKLLLYVTCATSIRSVILSDGVIIRGLDNHDDALGHTTVDIAGKQCYCGRYGCLECYSTIPSVVASFINQIKMGRDSRVKTTELDQITYLDIIAAADDGDHLAKEVIINAATYVANGLVSYIISTNPDCIVLSGLLIERSQLYYSTVVKIIEHQLKLFSPSPHLNSIYNSRDLNNITYISGASLFIQSIFSDVNLPDDFVLEN